MNWSLTAIISASNHYMPDFMEDLKSMFAEPQQLEGNSIIRYVKRKRTYRYSMTSVRRI